MLEKTCLFSDESNWLIDYLIRECKATWADWCACVAARAGRLDTFAYLVERYHVPVWQGMVGCCWSQGLSAVEHLDALVQKYEWDEWDLQQIRVDEGDSLLHLAVDVLNHDMIRHLMDTYNFDVYDIDAGNQTPLERLLANWDDEESQLEHVEKYRACQNVLETIQLIQREQALQ